MTQAVRFAGVEVMLAEGWFDITLDLPEGSAFTLARSDGVGALQFSTARFHSGERPDIGPAHLRSLLYEFFDTQGLGDPVNVSETEGPPILLCGDFNSNVELIRVWYATNGSDVVLATYTSNSPEHPQVSDELRQAGQIVQSTRF